MRQLWEQLRLTPGEGAELLGASCLGRVFLKVMDGAKQRFEGCAKHYCAAVTTVLDINCPQVQDRFKKIQGKVVDERIMLAKFLSFV